jgi:hypothetical protein
LIFKITNNPTNKGMVMANKQTGSLAAVALFSALLGGLLASFMVGGTAVAQSGKVLTQQGLQLVDAQGRVRAELAFRSVGGSSQPGLFLYAEDGKERAAVMILSPDGRPAVALSDGAGGHRLWLGLDEGRAPVVSLYDQRQGLRAALGGITLRNQQTGQPERRPVSSLVLVDEAGRLQWTAP